MQTLQEMRPVSTQVRLTGRQVGDRVTVGWYGGSHGHRAACREGDADAMSATVDGLGRRGRHDLTTAHARAERAHRRPGHSGNVRVTGPPLPLGRAVIGSMP
ncbi:hypothetical protein GCM10010507_11460 [Streptomyces cinnamoneus]|uniref:Uncharacterized protein n=1 Tax=Streptomyces cinnamoneus TaxID=53446 RepID=A0A918TDH0_STRCJ|nr:hypothetical protein GCM10010507_11460 [Streptomyces cinnamoneus]